MKKRPTKHLRILPDGTFFDALGNHYTKEELSHIGYSPLSFAHGVDWCIAWLDPKPNKIDPQALRLMEAESFAPQKMEPA